MRAWWINIFSNVVFKEEPSLVLKMDEQIINVVEMSAYVDLKAEVERLKKIITKELSENDDLGSEFTYVSTLKEQLEQAKTEIDEQCRFNGMGQERELKLMTQLDQANNTIERVVHNNSSLAEKFMQLQINPDHMRDIQKERDALKTEIAQLKSSMHSWEVAREIEMLANSDKQWNELLEERDQLREELLLKPQPVQMREPEMSGAYEERIGELQAEIERLKASQHPWALVKELEQAKAEIESLSTKLQRTINASYHALLEMSAWMGIPEKKREAQISYLMENVNYCAEHDLRHMDESQAVRDLKAEIERTEAQNQRLREKSFLDERNKWMHEATSLRDMAESYRAMLLDWLSATPTDKDGNYCPINQPQAFKARKALEGK